MTKINGTSSPVDTTNVDLSPQPTETKPEGPKAESHSGGSNWAEDAWLSKAADFGANALDVVGDAAASLAKQSGIAALARSAVSGVETVDAAAITLGNAAHQLLVEEKYKSLTLDPTAALDRVVAGANETMREVYGKDALQMTAHPDLDVLKYTVEVLSGSTGKLDQVATAAVSLAVGVIHENSGAIDFVRNSLAVGVIHENSGAIDFVRSSPVASALKDHTSNVLDVAKPLSGMGLIGPPLGIGFSPVEGLRKVASPIAQEIGSKLDAIRSDPAAARRELAAFTFPLHERLERTPVGDIYTQKFVLKGKLHEGVGVNVGLETKAAITKLGENEYSVTLTGKAKAMAGLGIGAEEASVSLDVGNEDEITATFLVSGQNAAQVIDSAGDLAGALASPAHAALARDGLTQLDASRTQVKLTAIEVKHQIGAEVGLGAVTVNPSAELSTSTGLAVQQKFELSLNSGPVGVSVSGLPPEQERSLQDCLKAMTSPSGSMSCKAEGSVRYDGNLSAEFKLDATSGQDRMSASIKVEVTDEAKLAQHLGIAKDDLKNLSPQFLMNKLSTIPADAISVAVEVKGYDGYLGANLNLGPAQYSFGSEHPTTYIKIPDPQNPKADLGTNLTALRGQIANLAGGINDDRAVVIKA